MEEHSVVQIRFMIGSGNMSGGDLVRAPCLAVKSHGMGSHPIFVRSLKPGRLTDAPVPGCPLEVCVCTRSKQRQTADDEDVSASSLIMFLDQ